MELRTRAPLPLRVFGGIAWLLALGVLVSVLRGRVPWQAAFVLALLGTFLWTSCRGWRMRRGRTEALNWYGLGLPWRVMLPLYFRRVSLAAFSEVGYREEVRVHQTPKGGTSNSYHNLVELRGSGHSRAIADLGSLLEARQAAKRVCLFLGLPLVEDSASGAVRTQVEELGLPLRERLSRRGQEPREPEPPHDCRIASRVSTSGVELELPRPPASWESKAGFVAAVFIACSVGGMLQWVIPLPPTLRPLRLLATSPLLLCLPWLHARLRRDRVRVSSGEVSVETRLLGLVPRRTRIPTSELEFLEEIDSATGWLQDFGAGGPGLRAVSPSAFVEFGWGLSAAERAYLKDVLYYYAAA